MNTLLLATCFVVCFTVVNGNSCSTEINGKTVQVPRGSDHTMVNACTFCWCVEGSDTAMCNNIDCPEWMGHQCPAGQSFKDVPGKCCRECM